MQTEPVESGSHDVYQLTAQKMEMYKHTLLSVKDGQLPCTVRVLGPDGAGIRQPTRQSTRCPPGQLSMVNVLRGAVRHALASVVAIAFNNL
jgi:hypothetical protein